jgi:DNA-binding NarL/FixJ family response regulator
MLFDGYLYLQRRCNLSQKIIISFDGMSKEEWSIVKSRCRLSADESSILQWLYEGWSVESIATKLKTDQQAVKDNVKSALEKIKKHGEIFGDFSILSEVWKFAKKAAR